MEKEIIYSKCKSTVERYIHKYKLTVDKDDIVNMSFDSFQICAKWVNDGKELNDIVIEVVVKNIMFKNYGKKTMELVI